ncbi:MAG: hypothetical protein RXP77_03415, partial [Nitrososphaeria archaeon]
MSGLSPRCPSSPGWSTAERAASSRGERSGSESDLRTPRGTPSPRGLAPKRCLVLLGGKSSPEDAARRTSSLEGALTYITARPDSSALPTSSSGMSSGCDPGRAHMD